MMALLLILFSITLSVIGGVEIPGSCNNNVSVIENFNVSQYLGLWYELHRYEQPFELGMQCVTANYTLLGTSVNVHNRGVVNRKVVEIFGNATQTSDGKGKLQVQFPGNISASDYWILNTNYRSYSVVYSCRNKNNTHKIISSWILSRTPELLVNDNVTVSSAINNEANLTGLSWNAYIQTFHDENACKSSATSIHSTVVFTFVLVLVKFLH